MLFRCYIAINTGQCSFRQDYGGTVYFVFQQDNSKRGSLHAFFIVRGEGEGVGAELYLIMMGGAVALTSLDT